MWHKKWDEKEEDSDQNKGASTSVNADTMAPLHELMNIVEHDGSNLSSALTNPLMTDPNIMTGGMSSAGVADTSRTSSPEEHGMKSNQSGVWDISGQMINVEQFSVQSDTQEAAGTDLPQKEHTDIAIKVTDDKHGKEVGVIDSAKTDNSSSEILMMVEMSNTEDHASAAEIKQEKIDISSKTDDIAVTDDVCQPASCTEHKDISTISQDQVKCDTSDTENTSKMDTDLRLTKVSGRIGDSQEESLHTSAVAETESGLAESSSILQNKSESAELELESKTDLRLPRKHNDLEYGKKIKGSQKNDPGKGSAECALETAGDMAENDETSEKVVTKNTCHESQSAVESSQQSEKETPILSREPGETSRQDSLLDNTDAIHPKDSTHEKKDLQVEEKGDVISKDESMIETNSSLQKKAGTNSVCGGKETVSTWKEREFEDLIQKEYDDEVKILKERESGQKSISEDKDKMESEKNEVDNYKGENRIILTCKKEKTEADIHGEGKTKIALGNKVVKGDLECETKDSKNLDAVKRGFPEDHYSADENNDAKTTHPETRDKTKNVYPREEREVEVHQPGETDGSEVMKSEDTENKEMGQPKGIEGIEPSQSAGIDATDLSQQDDMEGAQGSLDDDDSQLDDGDDLALDLGGLGAAGEGGMPGGSDLAALLSSQTELEQLVTQASSALASHVPTAGIVQSGMLAFL